jgi:hypothetical protein
LANKLRRAVPGTLVVAFAACALAPSAALAGTLDQQQTDVSGGDAYVDSAQSLAQTFTAGLTGNLDRVDLSLRVLNGPTVPMAVQIRNATAVSPGSTVLASQSIPPSGITGSFAFVPITFAAPASVAAGTHYAIVAFSTTASPMDYSWAKSSISVYAGGDASYVPTSPPSGSWLPVSGSGPADLAFKTYVAPLAAVPPTGERAAALKKCRKKHSHRAKKRCKKKAKKLPV